MTHYLICKDTKRQIAKHMDKSTIIALSKVINIVRACFIITVIDGGKGLADVKA